MSGKFFIVAGPIGNLEDITLRAIRTLKEVDLVVCEDTRKTAILLKKYEIHKPLLSYFQGNERGRLSQILDALKSGKDIAILSDAGTPGISDPGYLIVKSAIEEGISVIPIPGPSAAIAALCVSGLPTDSFVFKGFLSRKKSRRRKDLAKLAGEEKTIVLYESCHRIIETLKDILEIMGDRDICLARELTKKFEEVLRGSVSGILKAIEEKSPRGEYTIVMRGV